MQKLPVSIFVITLLILGYSSCKSKNDELVLKGNEYFPIKTGTIRFYLVDTFFYNSFTGETDTVSNTFKEEVREKFIDASGDTVYRIELSLFSTLRNKWEAKQSFTRKVSGNYAIENIANKPEVKLLFPISKYKTKGSSYVWNLKMLTNDNIENVKYISVSTSFNNQLAVFNDCVNIQLQSPEKGIIHNIREEVYAKGIGLVYRHIDQSDTLSTTGNRNGFEIFVRLKP